MYPTDWLDWIAMARVVDAQAVHYPATWPRPGRAWNWIAAGVLQPPLLEFPVSPATGKGGHRKKRLTKREARLVARSTKAYAQDSRDAKQGRSLKGSESYDTPWQWEHEQDVVAWQRWSEKLPMTRNVPGRLAKVPEIHIAATRVDHASLDEAWMHIEEWSRYRDWRQLRAIYGLSLQQAKAMNLYLSGHDQQQIAELLGVKSSTANEHLDRARTRMRLVLRGLIQVCDLILSPATAPLSMEEVGIAA